MKTQDENKNLATRILDGDQKIMIHCGNLTIPATLADNQSAKAFADMLPLTIRVNRYDFDLCGSMPEKLHYDDADLQAGWLNGDINYVPDGDWFAILPSHEEISASYGNQVNLGKVDCELSTLKELHGSYSLRIEKL